MLQSAVHASTIIGLVSFEFNVSSKNLTSINNFKRNVLPRTVVAYLLRKHICMTYPEIAKTISCPMTRVVHLVEGFRNDIKIDKSLAERVIRIESLFEVKQIQQQANEFSFTFQMSDKKKVEVIVREQSVC